MRGIPVMIGPRTLFHTLASDFFIRGDGTVYVQTGDIPAMWLRDSAAQTLPYVQIAALRPAFRTVILGVIARESRNVAIDPYANAFRSDYSVWKRKWEIDSLAYPVVLAWAYHAAFDDRRLYTTALHHALAITVRTYECERSHEQCSRYRAPGVATSAGEPAASVDLIWSAFRASDDATRYPYNIPEEMIGVTALQTQPSWREKATAILRSLIARWRWRHALQPRSSAMVSSGAALRRQRLRLRS